MLRYWAPRPALVLALTLVALPVTAGLAGDVEKLDTSLIPRVEYPAEASGGQTPLRVKVLVYEFNPWIPGRLQDTDNPDAKPRRLREVCGWNDPLKLAQGYMEDMLKASGGYLQYEIVEWNTVDSFQTKQDGFSYTPESYMKCFMAWKGKPGVEWQESWHTPDGVNYAEEIRKYNMSKRIDAGEADEVWWMGCPFFGYYESIMVGPDSYWVNAPPMTDFKCRRRFTIMGFNIERGVAEMIHDVGHRTESAMSHYYGGWEADKLDTNWARFAANEQQSGQGNAAVGTCHYPANAVADYDYANERSVESTAEDWLNYPNLTGEKTKVSRENWREPHKNANDEPDFHRNYQVWFFSHLPKAPGINADGRENNWWKYIYNFNAYDEAGKLLKSAKPVKDEAVEKQGATRPA
ncbi:MAG: hypothetical protein JXO22_03220 [Phycisphaerae bacterium]|nr:hypothetical protein [Phycisphaerae bacterium]